MLPPGLNTPRQVKQHYDSLYNELVSSGQFVPFLYPWATVGFAVVLVYLLLDHRRSAALQSLRSPLYCFLCAFSAWCILTNKARSPAASYGVGLCSAWGALWTGAVMFFNDCQSAFRRLERADAQAFAKVKNIANGIATGEIANGHGKSHKEEILEAAEKIATQGPSQRQGPLFWQPYPSGPFIERLDWILDVFSNFRGVGWNYQTYGLPPLPAHIEAEMESNGRERAQMNNISTSKTGVQCFSDRNVLLRYCLLRLVLGAALLDIIKTTMHHDAYFWGYMDAPPPAWLPYFVRSSFILVKSYRLILSLGGIYVALMEILRLGPVFFANLLGPQRIGVRGEPWSNPPDFYGNFSAVLDKGLAGWWGAWWHQLFRFGFEAPTTRILEALKIDKSSQLGKTIGTLVAFALSGCLHACGSYTQLGETRPLTGAFAFFAFQPIAILAQTAMSQWLTKAGITDRTPRFMRRLVNFLFVNIWLYHTAPLLVDDFAKGGIWLYEPLIVSPLRILGFGASDDNGWDLWYGLVFWRRGTHWWDTGIAF